MLATRHPDRGVDAVPVCFVVDRTRVAVPVDLVKPKSSPSLQRNRNLDDDPRAVLLCDHWDRRLVATVVGPGVGEPDRGREPASGRDSNRCSPTSTASTGHRPFADLTGVRDHRADRLVGRRHRRPGSPVTGSGPGSAVHGPCGTGPVSAAWRPSPAQLDPGALVPRQPVGPVGVDPGRELGVEHQLSRGAELREVGEAAPADHQVTVAEGLGVAL